MDDFADRVEVCAQVLAEAARTAGMTVSADGRVSEADAAALLGVAAGTLKNWRTQGEGPPSYATALAGCRRSYRLSHLASWIECGLER